jgi:AcrR family transcriptional regulator
VSSQDPIRKQLTEARQAQILDAAAKVFGEKGFHRATTKEIAETAGVSEGTIYNYFDSKADLLIGLMTRLAELEHLSVELTGALQGDAREFFAAALSQRADRIRQGAEILRAVLPEVIVNPELGQRFYRQYVLRIATMLERYLEAQIERGRVRPVDVPLTVRAVQGMIVGLLFLRILGDEPLLSRWDELPDVVATLLYDGLSPSEGG